MDRKQKSVGLLIALAALTATLASVFAYYPVTAALSPTSPPVYFDLGTNANKNDIGSNNTISNTIFVTKGSNGASLSFTVHPTYQTCYWKNITIIKNDDSKAYNIYLRVDTPVSGLPSNAIARIYVYNKGATRSLSRNSSSSPPMPQSGYVKYVDLTTTGTTFIGQLSNNSFYEIDVYTYIPEVSTLPSPESAQLLLIYTPSDETPP
jgi:hypothetical protein